MKVLWTHNFDPAVPNSQVFMNIAAEGLRAQGVDLHCEYLGNLRSVRNLMRARARVEAMAGDFDVVHAQYGSACALATSAAKGVPKVISIRGNDWNLHQTLGFHYAHTRLARAMTRWSLPSFDAVITVSRRVAADIRGVARTVPVIPLPSPIDLRRFVPMDRQEARARLGFAGSPERWVLFNALNLNDPIKRYPLARKAFDLASAKCGNLRLRVATDLPHEVLPLFTAACDVILCTSETEGWPNCVKEALACNVPFVATDVSDLAKIAEVESSCRVCPPDPATLAENLCEVLSAPAPASLRRHVEGMSLEASTLRLMDVYDSVARGVPVAMREGFVSP